MSGPAVVEITPEATHPLRREVLRTDTPSTDVVFDGDDLASTFHLGVLLAPGADPVCISTWLAAPYPGDPDRPAFQVRGMATAPSQRGRGWGSLVLAAGLSRCAGEGASLVWARARTTATGFYERHGFETVGDEFIDEATALPHRVIVRSVA